MFGSYPPFSLEKPLYDMGTFWGRTQYFVASINPLLTLETERSLLRHQLLLDRVKSGEIVKASDKELWQARMALESCIHPTSKEVLFPLFRFCAFLPVNAVIVPYMMLPSTILSVPRTVFIQWFNQSYNSSINYANRSSDKQPISELLKAYSAAVTVSVAGALGTTALMKKLPPGSTAAIFVRGTLPFVSVATAACVNLAIMRKNEWLKSGSGITVKDEDGVVRGQSTAAGRDSLYKCSVARVLWNLPIMTLPTLLMLPLGRFAICSAYPRTTETMLQLMGMCVGVPPALAAYDVIQTIPASALEPEFQNLTRANGSPVERLTYYKGL